jgi:hypothetical protein
VIASVREWREHEASLGRLHAMEDADRIAAGGEDGPPERMPPALEWWSENFALVRDISIRRYPVHAQSYDGLLRDPERVIRETIQWLGQGDAEGALKAPKPQHRNFERPVSSSGIPGDAAEVFDELYAAIDQRRELTAAFLVKLNQTNELLAPQLREHGRRVMADIARRRGRAKDAPPASDVPGADPS